MTTRLRKLYERLVKKDNSTTNSENVDIDDSATVPVAGFFDTKVKLPTYQVIERRSRLTTKVKYVSLSLSDVLSTIREEADLARRVLFETARLQRPPFSIGPLKLSKDPYDVDIKLVELGGVLGQGYNLIPKEACFNDVEDFHDRRRKQDLALNGNDFKTTLGTAHFFFYLFSYLPAYIMTLCSRLYFEKYHLSEVKLLCLNHFSRVVKKPL